MKNSMVKGVVLAAVASACGYAGAATIKAEGLDATVNVSLEGATIGNTTLANKAVKLNLTVTTAVSHFAGDEWQLTLSRGTWATIAQSGYSVTCTDGDILLDATPTYSADGKSLTFTVSATSGVTSDVGCKFSSFAVHGPSLSAGTVTVSFGAKRPSSSAFDRDLSTTSASAFTVASQLGSITVGSAFNGVVDYQGSAGKGFATDDGTGLIDGKEDTLVFSLAKATGDTSYSLTGNASFNVVLNAETGKSFSFLDVNRDGSCSAAELTTTANGQVAGLTVVTINSTCTQITFGGTAGIPTNAAGTTATIALGSRFAAPSVGTVGNTITPMDFPATTTANLNIAGVSLKSASTLDAGAWTSNGSTVYIPYMPVNTVAASRIAPVVYITNRSSVTGPATATMVNESGVECTASLGTIAGNRTTNVSNLINDAVKACYNTSSAAEAAGHRLSITIEASLPSASTEVYSAFTVGGTSRVSVVNSSNGK